MIWIKSLIIQLRVDHRDDHISIKDRILKWSKARGLDLALNNRHHEASINFKYCVAILSSDAVFGY